MGRYLTEAGKVIKEVRAKGRWPLVVGGTGYYVEGLTLKGRLVVDVGIGEGAEGAEGEGETVSCYEVLNAKAEEERWPVLNESTEVLLDELKKVDPDMAARWHPKDRRKIRRSLSIYLQTGRKASDIYAEQKAERARMQPPESVNGNAIASNAGPASGFSGSGALKHDVLFFYLHCPVSSLEPKLESRVQEMLSRGLLDEIRYLRKFHTSLIAAGTPPDLTRGIWVAIGYKEFAPYLDALEATEASNGDNDTAETKSELEMELAKLKAESIERMIIATRQYAKRQAKWVQRKLLPGLRSIGAQDRLFVLDVSDPAKVDKATNVVRRFLAGEELPRPEEVVDGVRDVLVMGNDAGETKDVRTCERCGVTVATVKDWERHLVSTKHRRALKRERETARRTAAKREGVEEKVETDKAEAETFLPEVIAVEKAKPEKAEHGKV